MSFICLKLNDDKGKEGLSMAVMSELFELAFFEKNSSTQEQGKRQLNTIYSDIEAILQNSALSEHKWSGNFFGNSTFSELILYVEDFFFTHKNFDSQVEKLSDVVDRVFSRAKDGVFATGVYELTGYNLERIKSVEIIDPDMCKYFPFLFYRAKDHMHFSPYKTTHGVSIVYNSCAQDIFADSITSLMIDEHMDYCSALKRLGL